MRVRRLWTLIKGSGAVAARENNGASYLIEKVGSGSMAGGGKDTVSIPVKAGAMARAKNIVSEAPEGKFPDA